MKLTVQVFSDTHIERISPEKYLKYCSGGKTDDLWKGFASVNSDVVVLAGDIGNPLMDSYWSFVEYISVRCKMVLMVAGNHEYWGNCINTTESLIREKISKYSNVRFLQRNFVIIDDTVFLGCTLWSYIPPIFVKNIEEWAGDFKCIKECENAEIFNSWHFRDLEWLINSICKFRKEGFQVVVVSHYSPNLELNFDPFFGVNGASFAFSSDLHLLYPYVKAWIYGHTHFDHSGEHKYKIPEYDTLFISNQRGSPDKVKKLYNPHFSLKLYEVKNTPSSKGDITINFNTYSENYVDRIQTKIDEWLKNGKKIKK